MNAASLQIQRDAFGAMDRIDVFDQQGDLARRIVPQFDFRGLVERVEMIHATGATDVLTFHRDPMGLLASVTIAPSEAATVPFTLTRPEKAEAAEVAQPADNVVRMPVGANVYRGISLLTGKQRAVYVERDGKPQPAGTGQVADEVARQLLAIMSKVTRKMGMR